MSSSGRPFLFLTLMLLGAGLCVRLGFWQLDRLSGRRAGNRAATEARSLPPIDLDDAAEAAGFGGNPVADRRVQITGRYDHTGDLILANQADEGSPGVRIVTPLRPMDSDSAVMVVRGFFPSPDAGSAPLDSLHEEGIQRIVGYAYPIPTATSPPGGGRMESPRGTSWRQLDLGALRSLYPFPVRPYFILQAPDSTLPRWPKRLPPPELSEGPHLSYAIQWFSFAVIAVVGGMVVVRRSRNR